MLAVHPHQLKLLHVVPPQRNVQHAYNEGTLFLAIEATQAKTPYSVKHASRVIKVPKTTLRQRRAGKPSRRDCKPNSKKLDKLEEGAMVRRILELDQGWIGAVRDMARDTANDLLVERGGGTVGKH